MDCDIIDKNYEKANFYTIPSGQELVFVKIQLFNKSYSDVVYSSLINFMGNYNGEIISPNMSALVADVNSKYKSMDGSNPRRQVKEGYVCYSLPIGWKHLTIILNIDDMETVEGEPVLVVENPKNREILEDEILKIREENGIDDFLISNKLGHFSDESINNCIIDFMHINCISKMDRVPKSELKDYLKKNLI